MFNTHLEWFLGVNPPINQDLLLKSHVVNACELQFSKPLIRGLDSLRIAALIPLIANLVRVALPAVSRALPAAGRAISAVSRGASRFRNIARRVITSRRTMGGRRSAAPPSRLSNMIVKGGLGPIERAPIATTRRINYPSATVASTGRGSIIISHREFLCDVYGSVNFASTQYSINPGISRTFPWLSRMANMYETYRIRMLQFRYQPVCGTTTTGTVMGVFDYDALDLPPSNKAYFLSSMNATRSSAWAPSVLPMNVAHIVQAQKYIRSGIITGTDLKTYDAAVLNLATSGCASTAMIGELCVEYIVELITPQADLAGLAESLSGRVAAVTGVSNLVAFGTNPVYSGGLNLRAAGNVLYLPCGSYMCSITLNGTVVSAGGSILLTPPATGTSTIVDPPMANAAATVGGGTFVLVSTVDGSAFTMDASANGTVTSFYARVAPYASN